MIGTTMEMQWDSACAEYIINDTLGRAMYRNMSKLGDPSFSVEEFAYAEQYTNTLSSIEKNTFKQKIARYFPTKSNDKIETLAKKLLLDQLIPYSMTTYPAGTNPHSWQYYFINHILTLHFITDADII